MRSSTGALGIAAGMALTGFGVLRATIPPENTPQQAAAEHLQTAARALNGVRWTDYQIDGKTVIVEVPQPPDDAKVRNEFMAASNELEDVDVATDCLADNLRNQRISQTAANVCIVNTLDALEALDLPNNADAPLSLQLGIYTMLGGGLVMVLGDEIR